MFTKKAFTLIETIIALTIFTIVAVLAATVMSNVLKSAKKVNAQVFLYTETQSLMDQLTKEIQTNTVDYEAYFARLFADDNEWATPNYGDYAKSFYSPGSAGGPDPEYGPYANMDVDIDGYGTYCPDSSGTYPEDCSSSDPITDSLDYDTGQFPFEGATYYEASLSDASYLNAFCRAGDSSCADLNNYKTNELILINSDGSGRKIFLLEDQDGSGREFRLSKVEMYGYDSDSDGIVDTWKCDSDYTCSGSDGGPNASDITDGIEGGDFDFMPISPSKLSITALYFYIAPLEDPYRAFAESGEEIQMQPQVTIIMTVTLNDSYGSILGQIPSITVQRTISTGVYSKINSYE